MTSLQARASALLRRMQFAGSSGPLRSELTLDEMQIVRELYDEIDILGSAFRQEWDKFTVAEQKAAVIGRNAIKDARARLSTLQTRARNLGDEELVGRAQTMLTRLAQLEKYTNPSAVKPQV